MPRQHGRRYTMVTCGTETKPPKPGVSGCSLTDFASPFPSPAKPYPLSAMTEFLCAVGVVPTRVYPKSGRISALAGRRAAYERVLNTSSERLTAMKLLVTTFIIKSDSVPALWAGAGPALSYEGGALWFQVLRWTGFFSGGCI